MIRSSYCEVLSTVRFCRRWNAPHGWLSGRLRLNRFAGLGRGTTSGLTSTRRSSRSLMCVDLLAVAPQEPDAGLNELLGPSGAGKINTASLLRTNRDARVVFSRISVRPTASGQREVCVFEQ
jgi:hypothetical protein